jgi:hypothetical protein
VIGGGGGSVTGGDVVVVVSARVVVVETLDAGEPLVVVSVLARPHCTSVTVISTTATRPIAAFQGRVDAGGVSRWGIGSSSWGIGEP